MSKVNEPEQEKFWFNLRTKVVERGFLAPAPERVGPFETEQEARQALDLLRKRSEQWREEESFDD